MSTKSVSKTESSKSMVDPKTLAEWGHQEVSQQDIIIPRILPMQPTSEFVADDKAKFGDLMDNLDMIKLGDFNSPFEIVPFKVERVWKIMGGKNFKNVLDIFPIVSNPQHENFNEDLEFQGSDKDGEFKRFRTLRFFVMLPSQLEALGDAALPYMLEFKSTSLRAGKKLMTRMFTKNQAAGLSPAAKTFMLSVNKETNDKGTFAVLDVVVERSTTKVEEAKCLEWFKLLQGGANVKEEGTEADV